MAFPRTRDDLVRIARLLDDPRFRRDRDPPPRRRHRHQRPVARHGLVVDISRHMNRILEIDAASAAPSGSRPGVVKDQLNAALAAARPVLRAGAVDLQPRHHRRHDHHGCVRPGLLPLRQDPRPRAGADHACCSTARSGHAGPSDEDWRRGRQGAATTGSGRSTARSTAVVSENAGADRRALPQAQPLPDRLRPRAHPRRSAAGSTSRACSAARRARWRCIAEAELERAADPEGHAVLVDALATAASTRRCATRRRCCRFGAASVETIDSKVLGLARPTSSGTRSPRTSG